MFATPSSRVVREYEWECPDENEQAFLQDSDQWRGTAWLKAIERSYDWSGTNLNFFGNEYSTVRLTDCEFTLYCDTDSAPVKVAVVFGDGEDPESGGG